MSDKTECPTCKKELIEKAILDKILWYCEECEDYYNTSYLFGYSRGLKVGKNE